MASNFLDSKKIGLGDVVIENYDGSHSLSTSAFINKVAPTDITISASSVDEDASISTVIGTFSSTDADAGDTFTYSIVLDADSKFAISGDDLITSATLDYSVSTSHDVTIRSTDSYGLTFDKIFTISVNEMGSSKSIEFNGIDEYIEVPYNADIDFSLTSPFSYSLWAKIPSAQSGAMCYFSLFGGVVDRIALDTTNGINLAVTLYAVSFVGGFKVEYTTATSKGVWQNIVFTWDGSTTVGGINVYIDGSVLPTPTINRDNYEGDFADNNDLSIGIGPGPRYFEGHMDDFGIWNKELTAAEVTEIYNLGIPSVLTAHSASANLIRYYKLGERDVIPTIEEEVSDKDGTATNMASGNITTDIPS